MEASNQNINQISLVFTTHRPEMVPLTADLMKTHDAVFLEEPPTPGFEAMLKGELSIDDYLMPVDVEYPEFSRQMCRLLRDLHARGIAIIQVEPFIEELLAIHEAFAGGATPADITPHSLRDAVYRHEKNATGALLTYYRTVMTENFDKAVSAIMAFAKQDAARFRLRDKLRAIAINNRIHPFRRIYIEAGVIHFWLYRELKAQLIGDLQIKPVFADRPAIRKLGRKGHIYGPGDQLTLLYVLHPHLYNSGASREIHLAARSLIYAKLIAKEEITGDLETYPHIRNELDTIRMVNRLSIDDCQTLFPEIRRRSTAAAVEIVKNHLA